MNTDVYHPNSWLSAIMREEICQENEMLKVAANQCTIRYIKRLKEEGK